MHPSGQNVIVPFSGVTVALALGPVALTTIGFTSAGIAAGANSLAARWMSPAPIVDGGVAAAQSIGTFQTFYLTLLKAKERTPSRAGILRRPCTPGTKVALMSHSH